MVARVGQIEEFTLYRLLHIYNLRCALLKSFQGKPESWRIRKVGKALSKDIMPDKCMS